MSIDYNSLLLAIGFSGSCLAITLFGSWIAAKTETFLLTWTFGIVLIVVSVLTHSTYMYSHSAIFLAISYLALTGGLAVILGAAYQFRTARSPWTQVAVATALSVAVVIVPFWLGYSGVVFMLENATSTALLFATARQYWKGRAEARGPIIALVLLYSSVGLSFALCAVKLAYDGQLILPGVPDNWTETVNLSVCIAGISGIGALSLALNQWRLAGRHRRDATTDAMTGLFNRRALFERYGQVPFSPSMAVILFDLDDFKAVNDRYGHAAGDAVIGAFGRTLTESCRSSDIGARLGGEEFALVLPRTLPEWSERAAERIRAEFAATEIEVESGSLFCTVSAGISFGTDEGRTLDQMLSAADKALYSAKRDGRNRIAVSPARRIS